MPAARRPKAIIATSERAELRNFWADLISQRSTGHLPENAGPHSRRGTKQEGSTTAKGWDLFHLVLGGVALASHDLILDIVVLLVLEDERLVIRPNQFYLQLAIGAVLLGVGGLIRDGVLITDRLGHFAENIWQFTHEPRRVAAAAGHPGKGRHLVLGLEVVHPRQGTVGT